MLLLRASPLAVVLVCGAGFVAIRPTGLVVAFVLIATVAAVTAIAWPGVGNTLVLSSTAAAYAVSAAVLSTPARIVLSLSTATVLYGVHVLSAVASNVPASSTVDRSVMLAALDHLALVIAVAAPIVVLAEQLATVGGPPATLRVAAVVAAAALTLVPLLIVRRVR